jgi:hypothetical protein
MICGVSAQDGKLLLKLHVSAAAHPAAQLGAAGRVYRRPPQDRRTARHSGAL